MPRQTRRVALGPLMGANSTRITDRALQGTYMRGGYNVELRDGEWWTRQGEDARNLRIASTQWFWILNVNRGLSIIANPFWALAINTSGQVTNLYSAAVTESVSFTNGSATATSTTTRVRDQLILTGSSGFTTAAYRVSSVSGSTVTLERPYEGTTGSLDCRFLDPLPRNTAGTATTYSAQTVVNGSAVLFEQLVTHSSTSIHAASPAVTGGNLHLVITSNQGCPVAIDIGAYLAGSPVGVLRAWFYNTALGTPAVVGSDTINSDNIYARGVWAEVYKGRLFIAAATDPSGDYGSQTIWWSRIGDLNQWHTGIAGQTAAPNFKTFDGEGNAIAEMKTLGETIVVHRQVSQEVGTATGASATPFVFRTIMSGLGAATTTLRSLVVNTGFAHYLWSPLGPAQFSGDGVQPLATRELLDALLAYKMVRGTEGPRCAIHDPVCRRIYWVSAAATRHQDALPATATVQLLDGNSVQNYQTVLVQDYDANVFWFEDRPYSVGGGVAWTTTSTNVPRLHFSRGDGTIVSAMQVGGQYADSSILTPTTSADDVPVNAQVETGWMDFGTFEQKRLDSIETLERSISAGGSEYDEIDSPPSGNWWLRCRVRTDFNDAVDRGDVGQVVASNSSQLSNLSEYGQAPTFIREFTFPSTAQGRQLKIIFSNALTSAATTASYKQAPFRISDVFVEISDRQSTRPRTALGGASISE